MIKLLYNWKLKRLMRKIRDEYEWDKYYEMQYLK